jgi:secreted PhoX family phosphatase
VRWQRRCPGGNQSTEKLLGFTPVAKSLADTVAVPAGYTASVVYALGDPLTSGTAAYKNDGTDTDYDKRAGDHHDGMEWFGLSRRHRNEHLQQTAACWASTTKRPPTRNSRRSSCMPTAAPHAAAPCVGSRQGTGDPRRVRRRGAQDASGKWEYVQNSAFNFRLTR